MVQSEIQAVTGKPADCLWRYAGRADTTLC